MKNFPHIRQEYYLDDCPYCHHRIVFLRVFWNGMEDHSSFFCPFCDSYINRHCSPRNVQIISKRRAFYLIYKTRHKQIINEEDLNKNLNRHNYLFKDVETILKRLRKRKINKKYDYTILIEIIENHESQRERLSHLIRLCKIIKPLNKRKTAFLENLIISDENEQIVAFLIKFTYNRFKDQFKEPINYRLFYSPKIFTLILSHLSTKEIKKLSPFFTETIYKFYTKYIETLNYRYFFYDYYDDVINNRIGTYGFLSYKKLKNSKRDLKKYKTLSFIEIPQLKRTYIDRNAYLVIDDSFLCFSLKENNFNDIMYLLEKTDFDLKKNSEIRFNIESGKELLIINKEQDLCVFFDLCLS